MSIFPSPDTPSEKNESVGGSIGIGTGASVNLSANEGKIDSDYKSVNEQTGIFAGKGGFDIDVVGNTDLKGAVIDSETDQNKLSTGTLTFSNMKNKAEYESNSTGVNYARRDGVEAKNRGITPNMGIAASGQESSTTKAAVAQGTIEIKDQTNQKDDLTKLSRDTENALNKLDEIFDKKTVEEQQELAKMFGEIAFEKIHDLSKDKGWDEGSPEKIALHAFVGAVMADMGGGDALSGGFSTAVNEAMQNELVKLFRGNPDLHQWASAILGAAAAEIVGGDALTGASTAASATKNNIYKDLDIRIQTDFLVNGKTNIFLPDGSEIVVELDDVTLAAHAILIGEALEKADDISTALMQLPPTAPAGVVISFITKGGKTVVRVSKIATKADDLADAAKLADTTGDAATAASKTAVQGLGSVPKNIYNSIKEAPKYPNGFQVVKNGTNKIPVKDQELLDNLRKIESGKWEKVYKDGYVNGKKVSIHYFESPSGKVFDVEPHFGKWSNKSSGR